MIFCPVSLGHFGHLTYDPSAEQELVPEHIFGLFGSNCLSKTPIREVVHSSSANFLRKCLATYKNVSSINEADVKEG